MTNPAISQASLPALATLFLPFQTQALPWPSVGQGLFLNARADPALPPGCHCQQSFKPFADQLERSGQHVGEPAIDARFAIVLVSMPRQRDAARALLARALDHAENGGVVVASASNNEGARSSEADFAALLGSCHSLSKNKCRVFWARATAANKCSELVEKWRGIDAPQTIAEGLFVSRPGLFSWDRIDSASALLVSCLPTHLTGVGADLGAGFGYLAAEVLARCPAVIGIDLYEAEARALALARVNLAVAAQRVAVGFHWHDVTTGLPKRYQFIVSNPPFHQGRADQPELGRGFISAAANALLPGGRLWLVANRHLPYEAALREGFVEVRCVAQAGGFKVFEALKAAS